MFTRLTQSVSEPVTQVVMTSEKPASLPPMVRETRPVEEFRGASWLFVTSVVTAPEQEVSANEDGAWAFFHR